MTAAGARLHPLVAPTVGVLFLNTLFTCANLEPTPWLRLTPRVSLEVALVVSLLALVAATGFEWSRRHRLALAAVVSTAAIGRYVHITVPGVMGRELDAHADLPHLRSVLGMLVEALSLPGALLVAAVALLVLGLVFAAVAAALASLEPLAHSSRARRIAWVASAALVVLFAGGRLRGNASELVAEPAAQIAASHLWRLGSGGREVAELRRRLEAEKGAVLPTGLDGAHVVVIFLESYGVTLIEDAQHYPYIAPRFALFEERLLESGFAVRSAKMVSPAFGGGSWRAHATLLAGVPIRDEHAYELLLGSRRRTLVHLLADAGYRTVAALPGIRGGEWPAQEYFRFDAVYDARRLDYRGKSIGWWVIPDQHTLFEIGRRELVAGAPPVLAHVVLISTHIPYFPVPPYVGDWSRFADGTAYERAIPSVAADDYRDLDQLSSRYVQAFLYELQILEDFLVERLPENALVVVAGDHQPPKLATHTNDSWAVPVHLLSRRSELVEPFARFGFEARVVPHGTARLGMEDFLPLFVRVFATGDARAAAASGR